MHLLDGIEEADDTLGLAAIAVGGRHADHDVVLPADASEVRRERRERGHEERRARALGERLQPAAERRREEEGPGPPAERLLARGGDRILQAIYGTP